MPYVFVTLTLYYIFTYLLLLGSVASKEESYGKEGVWVPHFGLAVTASSRSILDSLTSLGLRVDIHFHRF